MARPKINNNPFALIQKKPSAWKGLKGKHTDGFLIFENSVYGARAGFINLVNTYLNKGLNTIEKIFPVYAPAGHGINNPEVYIREVVKITGIPRDKVISTKEEIRLLGQAIVQHEEGKFWMTIHDFNNSFALAMQSVKINDSVKTAVTTTIPFLLLLMLLLTL